MVKKIRPPLIMLLCLLFCLCTHSAAFAGEAEGLTAQAEEAAGTRLVTVSFVNEQLESFSGLSVYDSAGQLCTPLADAASGAAVYGSYQLIPGEYSFRFHDETGEYEDLNGRFRVYAGLSRQFVSLDPLPQLDVQILSTAYINPVYIGIETEADLPESSCSEEELIEQIRQLNGAGNQDPRTAGFLRTSKILYDVDSAGTELRKQMLDFEAEAVIQLRLSSAPSDDYWRELAASIYLIAIKHTGTPTQGDYLRYECGGYNATGGYGSTAGDDGLYSYTFHYVPHYYTSAEQEAELTPVVNSILAELSLTGKSDYEKILAIYQYLTDHVQYGGSGNTMYTAYAALVNNLAVCQGYATAFYRLCLESKIDARIISSRSMDHAWNIVRFRSQYYALDSTWDRGKKPAGEPDEKYNYFLCGSDSWLDNHTLGDEFADADYAAKYVLPVYDFADVQAAVVYRNASLKGRISRLEDKIGTLAQSLGSSALGLDEIRVQFSYRKNAAGNTDVTASYEFYPVVAGYLQGTSVKSYKIGNGDLLDGPAFTVRLPVPGDWAGRRVDYTISASGFEDVSASADVVQSSSGSCTIALENVTFFGNVNMSLAYNVSFDSAGGSAVEAQSVAHGEMAVRPADPVKAGFWFAGWYADQAYSQTFDFENTPIIADTVLYARWIVPDLVLPAGLTEIEEEAFVGGAFRFVQLSERTETIGSRAFADCPKLAFIHIPAAVRSIDPSAFGDSTQLTVYGKAGSTAESFAKAHGFTFIAIP